MNDISNLMADYFIKSAKDRNKMQNILFGIFTETTGHRPEDLCLVEERIMEGTEMKTLYYYDWKHRHQTVMVTDGR